MGHNSTPSLSSWLSRPYAQFLHYRPQPPPLHFFQFVFHKNIQCFRSYFYIICLGSEKKKPKCIASPVLSDICIPVETDSPTHTTSSLLTGTLTHRDDGSWRDHWMWHHHLSPVYAIQFFFLWLRPFFAPFHVIFAPFVISWRATIFFIMNVLLSLWTLCFRSHSHVILCWMSSRHPVSLAI